jgi:DNA end-binding protein Ku
MAARSTWKGFIRLSLVSIPVKAYTATPSQGGEVRLNQLHAGCNSRIKYQKVCPIHGEVKADEIVSGYEYSKDQYVVIDPNELDKLRTEDSKALTIQEFVPNNAIDPMYYSGATHYLVPDGPIGQRPYSVLMQSMVQEKRHAIAQVVWHGKEKVVLLRPVGGLISMSSLSYDQEITKPSAFADEVPAVEIAPEEVKLTKLLIDATTNKKFDYAKYKDTYTDKLAQLVEAKVAGKEIVAPPAQEHGHVINLMDALKQSVKNLQKGGEKDEKPAKKMAPSKKERTAVARKKKSS